MSSPYNLRFSAPQLGHINKILISTMLAFFLLHSIGIHFFSWSPVSWFGLSSSMFWHGHFYQIISYPLVQTELLHFIFDALLFWFLGSELESQWGVRTFLFFLLCSSIGGGVFFLVLSFFTTTALPLYGPLGLTSSLCLGYAMVYKDRYLSFMFIFPMKAMHFCMLLIAIQLYLAIFSTHGLLALAHLGSMGGGYLYLRCKSWKIRRKNRTFTRKMSHLHLVGSEKEDDSQKKDSGPKYWQ